MSTSNQSLHSPNTLVTDLDGTLIPTPGIEQNETDLLRLGKLHKELGFTLMFATGRHFNSVLRAIERYQLPLPEWVICDVGTSIYQADGTSFRNNHDYETLLKTVCGGIDRSKVETAFKQVSRLQLQPEENQSEFKISYWCNQDELKELLDQVNEIQQRESLPYTCLSSVNPSGDRGLIDILPEGVDKAYALRWLANRLELPLSRIVYAGDSGNDLAALIDGYASVIVGNASDHLRADVKMHIDAQENPGPCYFADAFATSGVLEGMKHYGLIPVSVE